MQDHTELTTESAVTGQPDPAPGTDGQMGPDASAPPARGRLMIPVADLAAHPGNVRQDLNLTEEFTASVAAEGVRIPLLVTIGPDDTWRVIEGHRRLAAAVKAGLAEVPCDADLGRGSDEAGQYLDMLLANSDSYRANYTLLEETAALFAAHQAGASRTRIRKATGRTAAHVKAALAAGGLPGETRAQAAQASSEVTLEDLALLAEFDGDAEATERLLSCLEHGYPLEHAAERIRRDRAEAAGHARVRDGLIAAGVTVTDGLPDGAAWLTSLTHDGQDLTPDEHASCHGHGATFQMWNPVEPAYYCTGPGEYGHANRWLHPGERSATPDGDPGQPDGDSSPDPAADPDRRLVIAGNKAWQAAAGVRHRWMAGSLFTRRTAPREIQVFLARQLLAMPEPLRAGLASAAHKALFGTLTGRDAGRWDDEADTATAGRLALAMLAPVVTAYEYAMTEGEGRNTWRTDRYSPCPRDDAGRYLTFLATLGYQLSDIEHAVATGGCYTGTPAAGTIGHEPHDVDPSDPAPEPHSGDGATGGDVAEPGDESGPDSTGEDDALRAAA